MKIVNKFQAGGVAQPAPEAAPAADPIEEIVMMMQQGLQNQDCAMLAEACGAFLSLVSQASAPAPMGAENSEQPIFRRGGTISRKR